MVKIKTTPLRTQIHSKNLRQRTFDLVSIPQEVILRIPLLEAANPSINYHTQRITLGRKNSKKPTDEKVHLVEICEISQKQMRNIQQQKPHKVHTVWMKPVSGQLNAT